MEKESAVPDVSPDVDYQRFGAGELEPAWLNEKIVLDTAEKGGRDAVIAVIESIINRRTQRIYGKNL